jgi:hypothetical protein
VPNQVWCDDAQKKKKHSLTWRLTNNKSYKMYVHTAKGYNTVICLLSSESRRSSVVRLTERDVKGPACTKDKTRIKSSEATKSEWFAVWPLARCLFNGF